MWCKKEKSLYCLKKIIRLSGLTWEMVAMAFLEAEAWTKPSFKGKFTNDFLASQKEIERKKTFSKNFPPKASMPAMKLWWQLTPCVFCSSCPYCWLRGGTCKVAWHQVTLENRRLFFANKNQNNAGDTIILWCRWEHLLHSEQKAGPASFGGGQETEPTSLAHPDEEKRIWEGCQNHLCCVQWNKSKTKGNIQTHTQL